MTRILEDYVVHRSDCALYQDMRSSCTCGLNDLLAVRAERTPSQLLEQKEDKDLGAELINQPIPDMEGTEPRLNKEK